MSNNSDKEKRMLPGYKTLPTAKTIHQNNPLPFEQYQKLVGGYVEVLFMPLDKTNLVFNEDGKMLGLTMNHVATEMLHKNFPHTAEYGDYIVGDVFVLHGKARIKRR